MPHSLAEEDENKTNGAELAPENSGDTADSPSATDDKEGGVLDAIMGALNKTPEATSASESSEDDESTLTADSTSENKTETEDADKFGADESDSEKSAPRTQKRIRQLVEKTKALEAEKVQFQDRLAVASQAEERIENIRKFCFDNSVSGEDLDNTFRIVAAIQNDPRQGLQMLIPIVQHLQVLTGQGALEQDLEFAVSQGRYTEEAAREVQRLRAEQRLEVAQRRSLENKYVARTESAETEMRSSQRQMAVGQMAQAVSSLAEQWKSRDPDYGLKEPRLLDKLKLELLERQAQGTAPTNKTEAIALAEQVKKQVDAEYAKLRGNRRDVRPVTEVGGSTQPKRQPKSMMEAMEAALGS